LTSIRIQAAGREHLRAIPAIELAASAMFSERDLPLQIRYRVTDPEALREAQRDSRLWVALADDRTPVGFAMADTIDGSAHLDELDVIPKFGRRGIGTRLLDAAINWARDSRFPQMTLVTFRNVPWNAPFYEKKGFVSMANAELGDGLEGLLKEEGKAGIDVTRRVCMSMDLTA
jgi:GNAT superfamily N-acetyltransferase